MAKNISTAQNRLKASSPRLWYGRARFAAGVAIFLGMIAATLAHVAFSPCVFLRLGAITLACPLGALEVTLAGRGLILNLLPGFLLVCLALFLLGRAWCGWVCPASLWENEGTKLIMLFHINAKFFHMDKNHARSEYPCT